MQKVQCWRKTTRATPAIRNAPSAAVPAAPRVTDRGRQDEGDEDADPLHVAMLPHDHRVLLQVGHVVEGRRRLELEEQPADVRVEEPLGDVVGIFVVIDVLVVGPVFAGPEQRGVFKRTRTENQREKPAPTSAPERRDARRGGDSRA